MSARHRYPLDASYMSPKKPKINKHRLPIDFFEHSVSLELRKSEEIKPIVIQRDSGTPMFGKRRPSPLKIDRKIVTALDKHEN